MNAEANPNPTLAPFWSTLQQLVGERWLRVWRRPTRELRLCESLSLGERRFVAVVEFEERRFLVGGTGSSIALLAQLSDKPVSAMDRVCSE